MQIKIIKCPQCGNPHAHGVLDKLSLFLCHVCGLTMNLGSLAAYRKEHNARQQVQAVSQAAA